MTQIFMKRDRHSESGIALLIAIFVLLLITAIGAGMIMLTNTEINTSANFRDEQTALFASKAGIEEVRDRLRSGANNSLSGSLPTVLLVQGPELCTSSIQAMARPIHLGSPMGPLIPIPKSAVNIRGWVSM
jgi:Tfp pilus assembly protein PilX